jgi:hypothetical protein
MKRLLTLALVFAVMAAFAGLSAAQGAQKKDQKSPSTSGATTTAPTTPPAAAEKTTVKGSKSNGSERMTSPNNVMSGKVVSVDKVAHTFSVVANGKQVTFFANKLMLPDVGKMMDIHYIQPTPGGPMEATTIQPTPGGTFAVTNLNSSRSNISVSENGSTSKAIEPPPQKPKQEASISESGTMSSFRTATCPNVMTGKVLRVKKEDNTFTVMSKGKEVTFFAGKLNLPKAGEIMDICYTPKTTGGPFTSISLNSSRSNIY